NRLSVCRPGLRRAAGPDRRRSAPLVGPGLRLEAGDDLVGDPPPVVQVVAARRAEDEVGHAGVDVLADARLDRGRLAGADVRPRPVRIGGRGRWTGCGLRNRSRACTYLPS